MIDFLNSDYISTGILIIFGLFVFSIIVDKMAWEYVKEKTIDSSCPLILKVVIAIILTLVVAILGIVILTGIAWVLGWAYSLIL